MRGVVSLAAALALPAQFPARDVIVFLAFCAIFATLIVQGTTLGWLVAKLDVAIPEEEATGREELTARARVAEAALEAVKAQVEDHALPTEHKAIADGLVDEYAARADRMKEPADGSRPSDQRNAEHAVRLAAIEAARKKLAEHIDQVEIETHRSMAEELDLEEQQIRSVLKDD
jgi:CPA1 family monovalent cation:H+ antiporter